MAHNNSKDRLFRFSSLSMYIDFSGISIRTELSSLKNYIIDNKNSISKMQQEFKSMIESELKKHPENEQDIYEAYADNYSEVSNYYPTIFNNSTLIVLYSFFESNMKNICDLLHEHKPYKKKVKGSYIEESKKYLQSIAMIDLSDLGSLWEKINKYRKIRNSIVHNNSNIIESEGKVTEQPLYQIIKNYCSLTLDEKNGTFTITDNKFLISFIDISEKYLTSIIKKIQDSI